MKKSISLLTALALVISMTACSGGGASSAPAASSGAVSAATSAAASAATDSYLNVSIGSSENPTTLDVQKTSDYYGVPLNIYDRLVECQVVNGETKIVPGLADTWEISKDGLTYTFKLHKGVKFSNGEELKADDVVYTVNRMMDPATKAENTDVFDPIKGASDVFDGKAKTVSGIKAVDDYTVQMTLEKAFAPFLADLTVPGASIYNRKAGEAAGDKFGIDPTATVGTGPFIVKKWTLNSEIVLDKNPNYFKGAAKLDGVRMKIITDANTAKMSFENGELDVFDMAGDGQTQIPYFKQSEKWKNNIVTGPKAGIYYYAFNEAIKPLDNVKVRKAITMAIDRKTILEQLYNGEGQAVNTIVPGDIIGFNKNAAEIKYDVNAAKQLLTEAGYPNGFDLEVTQANNSQESLQMNQVIQSMLGQIGIKVKITQLDEATYLAKRKDGGLAMYRGEWSADYNDPDNFLYTFFSKKNVKVRSTNYTNTTVMDNLEKARTMVDADARIKLYQSAEQTILQDDAMFLPLFQLNHVFVVSNRVSNFKVSWNGWSSMSYYDVSLK
jgi:ABC-type transport system substrate-binding protein